jgi:hypothetical protein
MRNDEIPEIIRAAGDQAVRAYREFFDHVEWCQSTRRVNGLRIRRFFRWADAHGLTLETIHLGDWAAYEASLSPAAAGDVLSPLRRLAEHLVAAGILAKNPFPQGQRGRRRTERGFLNRTLTNASSSGITFDYESFAKFDFEAFANAAYQRGWNDAMTAVTCAAASGARAESSEGQEAALNEASDGR